jgi:hypothetical protein
LETFTIFVNRKIKNQFQGPSGYQLLAEWATLFKKRFHKVMLGCEQIFDRVFLLGEN